MDPGIDVGMENRSPSPALGDHEIDDTRVRELLCLCYEEGILPRDIDPGEMTTQGRNVRFKVKDSIDRLKVQWLKERTVTVIFRDAARFLPRNVKEDLIRAFEDVRVQVGDFGEGFSRGRVKVESLNMASYVAKSTTICAWLVDKRIAEVELAGEIYKLEFKPWLIYGQLREQRRLDELLTFWVIAVQVPLDAMFYLESHIRHVIGPVTMTHPPEQDRLKPTLVDIKFYLDPGAIANMKDSITVETFEGDELVVKLASSDTPRCCKCLAFFHSAEECRRGGRPRQQQGNISGQGGRADPTQEASSRQVPGGDGLPVELYLSIKDVVGDSLVDLYNSVLTGGKLAKNMRNGIISMLYKKGDRSEILMKE
ncbi:hypothetical protein CBR_g22958 [Chara braunii]|uniref:Uncharacterized protein n=1 Tax=Chara braunii TaxID=69332 RepID=A0A388L364_CHABU|nr:hypothetical protein CBR_g22958 [Chara braunii]|eukprot:GBG76741.1 hypothetical protein CBR_g22958 [Chara braunii]